jgi:hypothetical protein
MIPSKINFAITQGILPMAGPFEAVVADKVFIYNCLGLTLP